MTEDKGQDKKWKDLMDKLSTMEDLQNLTQLDIINLKTEIEKMRLTSTSPVPPEVEQKIVELEEIAKNVDVLKKWKQTIDEVKFLRSKIMGPSIPKEKPIETKEMEELRNEIEKVRKEMGTRKLAAPSPPIDVTDLRKAIDENRKTIESLKTMISEKPKAPLDLDSIRKMVNENRNLVEDLKLKTKTSPVDLPTEIHGEIEGLHKEIEKLESEVRGMKEVKPEVGGETKGLEELRNEIEKVRKEMGTRKLAAPSPPIDVTDLRKAIDENRKTIESLKTMVSEKPKAPLDLDSIKDMIKDNRKLVEEMRSVTKASLIELPTEVHREIDGLHKEIEKLESEVRRTKGVKPKVGEEPKSGLESLRNEIYTKLEEMNLKFGAKGSEEFKRAIDANRANIEKLKNLIFQEVSGEGGDVENLRKEIEQNRKLIENLKKAPLVKETKTGVALPPEPKLRKKMLQIEQRVESLGRKLDKMNKLKPIKIPRFPPAVAAKIAKGVNLDRMKKDIESVLSRMDDFVTKDDVKKGFVERRIKTDEKLVKDELYKELNEIKKAIIRNEDHINNLTSDMEEMKREVGAVEKREWGKIAEMPDIEKLKKRIEELEKRLESIGGRPVFIE